MLTEHLIDERKRAEKAQAAVLKDVLAKIEHETAKCCVLQSELASLRRKRARLSNVDE